VRIEVSWLWSLTAKTSPDRSSGLPPPQLLLMSSLV
jgi:hypothetical protein